MRSHGSIYSPNLLKVVGQLTELANLMTIEQTNQELTDRVEELEEFAEESKERATKLEDFVAGMSRRVILARGEAMASTFSLVEVVNTLSRDQTVEKFSMGAALRRAEATLDQKRGESEPKTQAAIDHARLLLKGMQASLVAPQKMTLESLPSPGGRLVVNMPNLTAPRVQ
jgi:hypothetical protein